MKALIFNPFSGAAGDMILGATLDLGADREYVRELVEASVDVSMEIKEVLKKGIKALDVKIKVPKKETDVKSPKLTYPELVDLVKAAKLPSEVETSALDIFLKMAEAEASDYIFTGDDGMTHFYT